MSLDGAVFTSFADDSCWRDGSLVVPGGKHVMERLRAQLVAHGGACSSVGQRSFYGWEMEAELHDVRALFVIQPTGDDRWLLQWRVLSSWCERLRRLIGLSDLREAKPLTDTLAVVLASDDSFANVRWYSHDEIERGDWLKDTG